MEKHLPAVPEGGDKTQPKPGPEKEQDRERGSGRPAGPGSWPAARLSRDPKAREGRPSHGPGCSRPGPHLAPLPGAGRRARGTEAADAPTPAPRLAGIWGPADRRVPGARAAAPAPSARRPRLSPPGPPAPALALTCRRCSVPAPAAAAAARVAARPRAGSSCAGGGGGAATGAPRWPPGPRAPGPAAGKAGDPGAPAPLGPRVPPPCPVFSRKGCKRTNTPPPPPPPPAAPRAWKRSARPPRSLSRKQDVFKTRFLPQSHARVWTRQVQPHPRGQHFLANSQLFLLLVPTPSPPGTPVSRRI